MTCSHSAFSVRRRATRYRVVVLTSCIYASAVEALTNSCDVFVEYTNPDIAKKNILAALKHDAHVVGSDQGPTGSARRNYFRFTGAFSSFARICDRCGNSIW